MSDLDDILKKFRTVKNSPEFGEARKQEIKDLMLEIIENTEILGLLHPQTSLFKEALRQKVKGL